MEGYSAGFRGCVSFSGMYLALIKVHVCPPPIDHDDPVQILPSRPSAGSHHRHLTKQKILYFCN